jgi:hypothetical protein
MRTKKIMSAIATAREIGSDGDKEDGRMTNVEES